MSGSHGGIDLVNHRLFEGVGEPRGSYVEPARRITDDGPF